MDAEGDRAMEAAPLARAVAFRPGTDVLTLARAWFPDADQVEQVPTTAPPRLRGARFAGQAGREDPIATTMPGLVRLTEEARLRGPLGRGVVEVDLPAGLDDVYLVEGSVDALLSSWLIAAARRAGGAVVDGSGVVAPVADEYVGLTVYASTMLPAERALGHARSAVPMMGLAGPITSEAFQLAYESPYDGTLLLHVGRRTEVPVALAALDPDSYGTCAYALTWRPPGLAAERADSAVGRIARDRVVPLVARLAHSLQAATGGTVIDIGGFPLTSSELRARASR